MGTVEDLRIGLPAGAEPLRHAGLPNGLHSRPYEVERSNDTFGHSRPKSRNPEILKELFSRPLTFVLDVILVDLKPLFTKSDQNLVPDRDAGFRVAEA